MVSPEPTGELRMVSPEPRRVKDGVPGTPEPTGELRVVSPEPRMVSPEPIELTQES